jgi:hypothetical protein
VLEHPLFLPLGKLAVGIDAGRVLYLALGDGQRDVLTGSCGTGERDGMRLEAEEAAGDRRPSRLAGLPVLVDLLDRAQLLASRAARLRTRGWTSSA